MFAFTDEERIGHTEFRALTTDGQGREVLVGLSYDETVWYMEYKRKTRWVPGQPRVRDLDGRGKYLELHAKHELARLEAIGSEVASRDQPKH